MGARRGFDYRGQENTCLWCGRKFKERYAYFDPRWTDLERLISEPPKPGEVYPFLGQERTVRLVEGRVRPDSSQRASGKRDHKASRMEDPSYWRIYFDPPVWETFELEWGASGHYFDTEECAAMFGSALAHHGGRLKKNEG